MIHLETGHLRFDLLPEEGACIWSMELLAASGWQPVLMADSENGTGAFHSGLFWMLPFANRARQNRLHDFQLPPNTGEPLALHGMAWSRAWDIEVTSPRSVQLVLPCREAEAPFPFSAGLALRVEDTTFRAEVWLRNEASYSVPAGLGVHPFFPALPGTTVQFDASHFYLEGPDHLPTDAITLTPELDFSRGAALPRSWRNNAYGGWNGRAWIRQPELGYQIEMQTEMRELMFYTAPGQARFAFEPQTHTSGATLLDAPDPQVGLTVLRPGQVLSGDLTLTVSPLQ